jgi:hypothetical protein
MTCSTHSHARLLDDLDSLRQFHLSHLGPGMAEACTSLGHLASAPAGLSVSDPVWRQLATGWKEQL